MTDVDIIKALRNPAKGASGTVRWGAAAAIERLTAERDALLEVARAIEGALRLAPAAEVLDENSPIRDGLRAVLAQIGKERT